MGDWPNTSGQWGTQQVTIGVGSLLSLGTVGRQLLATTPASTAWPAANRAILVPFRLPIRMVACQLIIGAGTTASGNFDAGIYDRAGNLEVAIGATAKSASTEQVLDITDTPIGPGVYYLALAADGTNNYIAWAPTQAALVKAVGVRQASSAYTLTSTITFETVASSYIPNVGVVLIPS